MQPFSHPHLGTKWAYIQLQAKGPDCGGKRPSATRNIVCEVDKKDEYLVLITSYLGSNPSERYIDPLEVAVMNQRLLPPSCSSLELMVLRAGLTKKSLKFASSWHSTSYYSSELSPFKAIDLHHGLGNSRKIGPYGNLIKEPFGNGGNPRLRIPDVYGVVFHTKSTYGPMRNGIAQIKVTLRI